MESRSALPFVSALLIVLAGCGDDDGAGPKVDATPPGRVGDLTAASPSQDRVLLTWTAPGDDAMEGRASRYDVRYSPTPLTPQGWASAPEIASPLEPKPAGEPESLDVAGTDARDWYFTLRTADETYNWSLMSNVASARFGDGVPPAFVTDLSVVSTTTRGVTLAWTAPGDDGAVGTAAEYDVRYAQTEITPGNWAQAVRVTTPAPRAAGAPDSVTVGGLDLGHSYYFALRTADEFSNWSALSNVTTGVPGLRRLTTSPEPSRFGAQHAGWSPDGGSVAFAADWAESENLDIYTMPADGGTAVRLTSDPASDDHPSWSPDGGTIAFTARRSGRDGIWVMDAVSGAGPVALTDLDEDAFDPTWSPDGKHVAYIVRTSVSTSAVYVDSSAGGLAHLVHEHPSMNTEPAWCPVSTRPDTSRIAITSDRLGEPSLWYVWNVGGGATRVSFVEAAEGSPCWSPHGSSLAFHSDRSGNFDIWILSLTGEGYMQLTFDPASDTHPAWSADSTRIAFTSRRGGKPEIWIQELE